MASSDDEADVGLQSVSNYHFVNDEDTPISFSVLPLRWSVSESVNEKPKQQIFLHGSVDKGLQTIHKEVTAWNFDVLNAIPEISVLTKENNWIKLEKPRKSFEEVIRTILITVQCLHFSRRNPGASEKSMWDHLSKVFSSFDVRPSLNDLVDHMVLISEAVKRDDSLAESKFLLTFLEEKPRKRKLNDEDVQATNMSKFIVDDEILEAVEEDESNKDDVDDHDDLFDSVCAFCDNGGALLCCEGNCMRSFHATEEAGRESLCASLGFTEREVEAIKSFYCKNCQYKQHQCFACGELGSSDKVSRAEVFRCANATCGHFYHPHCIAKLLHPEDEVAVQELEKKIASGVYFTCPIHKCCVCKQGENKKIKELQFAVCRRCPASYHRKCLPKEIFFEKKKAEGDDEDEEEQGEEEEEQGEEEEEEKETRAWEGLLPNRVLIYCLKHEIIDHLGTPIRDIRFPDVGDKMKKRISESPGSSGKVLLKKRRLTSEGSLLGQTSVEELTESSSRVKKVVNSKKDEKIPSGLNSSRKLKAKTASRMSLKENMKYGSTDVDRSAATDMNKDTLGDRLFEFMNKQSEQLKLGKQDTCTSDIDKKMEVRTSTKNLSSELPSLDADTERRILALMKEVASVITMEKVMKKHEAPSTHAYSSKNAVDKTITAGKVEGAVEAVKTALKKLEDGCSTEDAKAVCEPEVLNQVFKWKNKLRVYLAPFLYGMRYTSFGRHFTKVEKLKEIVNLLHWYVQDGDMVVDFCCGANDFSVEMKKKLEEMGKKCSYKNYDLIQPKNYFNFEKRDWMTVRPDELLRGSQLIMGINPPFGVKAALANKFIDKALEFKPKLLVLIVPPETERLDQKNPPYDLVWEDDKFLSGKSFYLPGSVDENDKQMDQWNVTTPPLYLWSRPDWSAKHKAIAQKHGHLSRLQGGSHLEKSCYETKNHDHPAEVHCYNIDSSDLTDDLNMESKEAKEPNHEIAVAECSKEAKEPNHEIAVAECSKVCFPDHVGNRESRDIYGPEENPSMTSRKIKHGEDKLDRGISEKLRKYKWNGGKSPESDTGKGIPHHSPSHVDDKLGRGTEEKSHSKRNGGKSPESDTQKGISHRSPHDVDKPGRGMGEKLQENRRNGCKSPGRDKKKVIPQYSPQNGEGKLDRGISEKIHDNRRNGGKSPGSDSHKGVPHCSPRYAFNARSPQDGPPSKSSSELSMHREVYENSMPNMESSSHMPYGTAHLGRQYGMNGTHGFSHGSLEEPSTGHMRESAESISYRYIPDRELNMQSQVRYYGQDPEFSVQRNYLGGHESGYRQLGSLSSPYGHLGAAADSSYRIGMSAMQRYAPRLDELNHTRTSNIGPDPSMVNRNGMYNSMPPPPRPPPPQPGYSVDSMGFAPGPHYPYARHNSAGWLNE